jgi:hypothetical protein
MSPPWASKRRPTPGGSRRVVLKVGTERSVEEGRRPLLPRLHPKLEAGVQGRLEQPSRVKLEQPSRVKEVAIASSADEHLRVVDLNAICRGGCRIVVAAATAAPSRHLSTAAAADGES